MKIYLKLFLIGFFVFVCHRAYAEGECDKYTTSYDHTFCFSKLFVESDKELNSVYKELRGVVKETVKTKLTEAQRDWIKYRDLTCQPTPGTINVKCNYEVNRNRTEYLRDRLRECKTGNCREDMIVNKSWN